MTTYTNHLNLRKIDERSVQSWHLHEYLTREILDVIIHAMAKRNRVRSGGEVTAGAGLNINFEAMVLDLDTIEFELASGTSTVTGAGSANEEVSNWVYIDSNGNLQVTTNRPSGSYIPLALVDTDNTEVKRISDLRCFTPPEQETVENECINGTFDRWIRGNSQSTTGRSSADHWNFLITGNPTVNISRKDFTPEQTDVPGYPKHYCEVDISDSGDPAAGRIVMYQKGYDIKKYAGKSVQMGVWAKGPVNSKLFMSGYCSTDGGGANPSNSQSLLSFDITDTWEFYNLSVDIGPLNPGGFGDFSHFFFQIYFTAGTDISSVNSEIGTQTGTFCVSEIEYYPSDKIRKTRRRSEEETAYECDAFAVLLGGNNYKIIGNGVIWSATEVRAAFPLPRRPIRSTPTSAYIKGGGGALRASGGGNLYNSLTTPANGTVNGSTIDLRFTTSIGGVADACSIDTNDTEGLMIDFE